MKKIITLALVASVLAGAVQAQTWVKGTRGSKFNSDKAVITSGSTITALDMQDISAGLTVTLSATTNSSVTIQQLLSDGTILSTTTILDNIGTTPLQISYAAPLKFQGIKVSNTTALSGVNAVHAVAAQSKQ